MTTELALPGASATWRRATLIFAGPIWARGSVRMGEPFARMREFATDR